MTLKARLTRSNSMAHDQNIGFLLEEIRRTEAEVKRRLAATREAAGVIVAQAEKEAHVRVVTARKEGQRTGEAQRQAAQAETSRKAEVILKQARFEAEILEQRGQQQMAAAVMRALNLIIGNRHET